MFAIGLRLNPSRATFPSSTCSPLGACHVTRGTLLSLPFAPKATSQPTASVTRTKPRRPPACLDSLGDPYTRTGVDIDGRIGIDWRVHGVPESFVIDRNGRIAYKHVGALTPEIVSRKIRPLLAQLKVALILNQVQEELCGIRWRFGF